MPTMHLKPLYERAYTAVTTAFENKYAGDPDINFKDNDQLVSVLGRHAELTLAVMQYLRDNLSRRNDDDLFDDAVAALGWPDPEDAVEWVMNG